MSMRGLSGTQAATVRARILGSIQQSFDNVFRRKQQRQMREEQARLQRLTVRMVDVTIPMTPQVRRLAVLFEQLPFSRVLSYGYRNGEALALAASIDPELIDPLVAALKSFTDGEILGRDDVDVHRSRVAVGCRNELMEAVRDIVAAHPKSGAAG